MSYLLLLTATLLPVQSMNQSMIQSTIQEPARRIMAEVRRARKENAARPRPQIKTGSEKIPVRLRGDALTDHLVRAAARAALWELRRETSPHAVARGFLVALGISLDHWGVFESHPALRLLGGDLDTATEDEKRARRVEGAEATLRGRVDSLQHFVVASALTALVGEAGAWAASTSKEVRDAMDRDRDRGKGSGFSFADLAADQAGILFARRVLEGSQEKEKLQKTLESVARKFRGQDHVPDLTPLEKDPDEGLGWKKFQDRFGSLVDPRFQMKKEQAIGGVLK